MPKEGKFAELFDNRLKVSEPTETRVERGVGKRSHPDFKQYSILLKKATHKQASRILAEAEEKDMSDLVQELLEGWVKTHG